MQKGVRWVFAFCLLVTLIVVGLQAFWLRNFYKLNHEGFEREVNLALEDGIKTEFAQRNDIIEKLLFDLMMDTTEIKITSSRNPKDGRQMYQIINAKNPKDYFSFSRKDLSFPLLSQQDTNKHKVALAAAQLDREQDLDHHIIFYRTQNIGRYLQNSVDSLSFDTARLRPFLKQALARRDIHEPFVFVLKDQDNTLNKNNFPDSIRKHYPVITKAFPTFRNQKNQNYVRAYFKAPAAYLLSKTANLVAASAVLLLLVGVAFTYLIQLIRKEKKLARIKTDFINHITHEFKTPIATVHSAVQALEQFDLWQKEPAKAKRYLQLSRIELERLSDLVTKVLQISLYEQQGMPMRREPVNLQQLLSELMAVYGEGSAMAPVISYQQQTTATKVIGDRHHLYNAINNLIDNAVKYAAGTPSIAIALQRQQHWVVVSVSDNGPGIDKQYQELIFDRFYRINQPGFAQVKGFGLGLSYVKDVVEKHKGWYKVQSSAGAGTTFFIGLPFYDEC